MVISSLMMGETLACQVLEVGAGKTPVHFYKNEKQPIPFTNNQLMAWGGFRCYSGRHAAYVCGKKSSFGDAG